MTVESPQRTLVYLEQVLSTPQSIAAPFKINVLVPWSRTVLLWASGTPKGAQINSLHTMDYAETHPAEY